VRHASSFDARRGRVAVWLLTIARNVAIDRARLRRAPPAEPDVIVSRLDVSAQDALPDVAQRERVREALSALPEDQRRALVLAVYAGRTAREISELDEVPLGTVKTRIRAAMLKLRETLEVGHEL
jgi:RNA polymerase sigma factor (sigma-70 family)